MTEVNEVFSMGAYLWPWSECLSLLSGPFYCPTHSGRLLVCWLFFPLIVFPGSGENCTVCVCVFRKHSTLALVFLLQLFCGMLQDGRSLSKQEVKILSTTFLKTWHTSFFIVWFVVHWISKQLSKAIFFLRKYKWNLLKSLLCRFEYCTTVGHSCRKKGPLIPRGGTSKLFVREKHECKLSTREPGQRAKSNSALRRTFQHWSNSWCLGPRHCTGSQLHVQTSLSSLSWELASSTHQGKAVRTVVQLDKRLRGLNQSLQKQRVMKVQRKMLASWSWTKSSQRKQNGDTDQHSTVGDKWFAPLLFREKHNIRFCSW